MYGFYRGTGIYCVLFQVERFSSKIVKGFMITDQPEMIIQEINHREHFQRRKAGLSFSEAVDIVKKKIPEGSLPGFGIADIREIRLNQWYYRKK